MANWVQNQIRLEGPTEEIERFVAALSGEGCEYGCRTLCMHKLTRLLLPNEPERAARYTMTHRLVDDDPYDPRAHVFNVYSAWVPICRLLWGASGLFPGLTIRYWFCDLCAGCGHEWTTYSMTFQGGKVRDISSHHLENHGEGHPENVEKTQTHEDLNAVLEVTGG